MSTLVFPPFVYKQLLFLCAFSVDDAVLPSDQVQGNSDANSDLFRKGLFREFD